MVTAFGYALGIHAPGKALMLDALPTVHYQLLGHGLANAALRAAGASEVMITNNYSPAWPASSSAADIGAAGAYDVLQNRIFTDPILLGCYPDLAAFGIGEAGLPCVEDGDLKVISAPIDGLGVNYYNPTRLSALPDSPLPFQLEPIPGYPVTAFGWPVVPEGLSELLGLLKERYAGSAPPDLHHRERLQPGRRRRARRHRGRPRPDRVPGRPSPCGPRRDHGRHRRARLLPVDAHRQLRVERGLPPALRADPPRHPDSARTPKASFTWYRNLIAGQLSRHQPR